MSYSVNEKIRDLKPYDPIEGSYRIRLDANESFQTLPPEILEKLRSAASSVALNRYPDPLAGEVCRAFADYYGISPENVAAGDGSDELISLLEEAFLMRGETILTLSPDFSMYRFYSGIAEANCVDFKKDSDFSINVDELIRTAKQTKARIILFSNPCNPTSVGLYREDVRRLIRSVDALVVLDEAYMDFWNQSLLQEVNEYDNLIILRTCSKAVGLAAVRLGFAVANTTLIRLLKAVKSPYNVNSVTQKIGAAVLREKDWLQMCTEKMVDSKNALYQGLKQVEADFPERIHAIDGVTNFVTVLMADSKAIYRKLLAQGIAVRCFSGFLRITAGSQSENAEVLKALRLALRETEAAK